MSALGLNLNFDCAGGGKSNGTNVQLWERGDAAWHCWRFVKIINDGDINDDGEIDIVDVSAISKHLRGCFHKKNKVNYDYEKR